MSTAIFLFRNDLRLHDHIAFNKALALFDVVIPVYILDPKECASTRWGWKKKSARRMQFLLESLADLKRNLQNKSSDLLVLQGSLEDGLNRCKALFQPSGLVLSKEAAFDEVIQENTISLWCKKESIQFLAYWNSTLAALESLPFLVDDLPDLFTTFRNKVERKGISYSSLDEPKEIRSGSIPPSVLPSLEDLGYTEKVTADARCVYPFKGGESAGIERLEQYIWEDESIATYKLTRNGMVGASYSSKFSPWLAVGALSARRIAREVADFEEQVEKNESTYWMIFELLWRDFFRFTALKQGKKLFLSSGFNGGVFTNGKGHVLRNWNNWSSGTTGDQLVDANMQELLLTGWMSNRGRQNVASYAIHEMQLPWVMCASFFEHHLLDYDPCSNYGNWAYLAGVGNDARNDRKFNTKKQAEMYDGDGQFRSLWLK